MAYTTINKSSEHFNTKLYTGNFTDNTDITGVGFQPDLVWLKERSSTSSHLLQDAVRGANKDLFSDLNSAEESNTNRMKAFISDGFTLGAHNLSNQNGETYAAWNWKANGAGSANTDGSINSTVSANTTSGFSIVSYTGNETVSTIGHGLGVTPSMIIVKGRIASRDWIVGHHTQGWTKSAMLNVTDAFTNQTHWNNTAPTSSVFTIEGGSNSNVNTNNAGYIAYCFAEKQGYSKFGEYGGNGNADGPFIFTGFKPAFVMLKRKDANTDWSMKDNRRPGYNVTDDILYPNLSDAEGSGGDIDIVSNGFKIRTTADNTNGNDGNPYYYIYMAFAEAPLVGTNGVTAKAR